MHHPSVSASLSPGFSLVVGRPAEWKMCASFHIINYVYNGFGESIEKQTIFRLFLTAAVSGTKQGQASMDIRFLFMPHFTNIDYAQGRLKHHQHYI